MYLQKVPVTVILSIYKIANIGSSLASCHMWYQNMLPKLLDALIELSEKCGGKKWKLNLIKCKILRKQNINHNIIVNKSRVKLQL